MFFSLLKNWDLLFFNPFVGFGKVTSYLLIIQNTSVESAMPTKHKLIEYIRKKEKAALLSSKQGNVLS